MKPFTRGRRALRGGAPSRAAAALLAGALCLAPLSALAEETVDLGLSAEYADASGGSGEMVADLGLAVELDAGVSGGAGGQAVDLGLLVAADPQIGAGAPGSDQPERPDDVISVTAPFQVSFRKGAPDETGSVAYRLEELDESEWVESVPQAFTNNSRSGGEDAAVYVASVECVDVRASDFFPARIVASADGSSTAGSAARALRLYRYPGGGGGAGSTLDRAPEVADGLRFGWVKDASYLVENGDPRVLALAPGRNERLYFGLDLREVAFDETALFAGADETGKAQYDAQLANVKYTYKVVPSAGQGS